MNDFYMICYVICNSLPDANLPYPKETEKNILKILPTSTFGVFVTTREDEDHLYGCLGNFDMNSIPSKQKILGFLQSLSFESANNDVRFVQTKNHVPLEQNVNATFEVSLMQQPMMKINPQTGEFFHRGREKIVFHNHDFGVIYRSNTGRTTTFLPNVFPDGDWSTMLVKLKEKSGTNGPLHGDFFAFSTISIKDSIRHVLFSTNYLSFYISESVMTIKMLFEKVDYVPYMVQRNTVEKNELQYVRNIATLYDLLRFNLTNDKKLDELIMKNVTSLEPLIKESMLHGRLMEYSALGFYLLCLHHIDNKNPLVPMIKQFLFQNIHQIPKEYQLPECLIALCRSFPTEKEKKLLESKLDMLITPFKNRRSLQTDTIFQMNWIAKYIYTVHQTIGLPKPFPQEWIRNLQDKMILFQKNIHTNTTETNEIAVCFEGLCSLFCVSPSNDTMNHIWTLFLDLNRRRKDFLFSFLDGTFRIDITGHVLNGCYVLFVRENVPSNTFQHDMSDSNSNNLLQRIQYTINSLS